jgi:hypothetical protein
MKVSYATPAGSPSYTVLGDEADRTALFELFAPGFQPLNQIEPLAGGTNTFKAIRGNIGVQLQIVVSIPYASTLLALESIYTLRNNFTVKKHLKVEQTTTVHFYPNAVLVAYAPVVRGVTVQHSFTFATDELTKTIPTT